MIIAELPSDEELRLKDLASYQILDTHPEDDFDGLIEIAAKICDCPISLISLVTDDKQWFKAKRGLEEKETPREISFCAHAILSNNVMSVEDARTDPRFSDNPLVTGKVNIQFYAGVPIVSPSGHNLGTICVLDNKPRKLTVEQEKLLKILSAQITKLLDLRKKNIIIRERADEIITWKTGSIKNLIQKDEEKRMEIAVNLHEDLAQRLAISMLNLDMAVMNEEKRVPIIKTTKELLSGITSDIKKLTYDIAPYTSNWIAAEDLVQEFIEKIENTFAFDIHLKIERGEKKGTPENAITTIRIIENWLEVLAEKNDISVVNISISVGSDFELLIEDDSAEISFEKFKAEVIESLVYSRVHSIGGIVDLSISSSGKNLLKIILPSGTVVSK